MRWDAELSFECAERLLRPVTVLPALLAPLLVTTTALSTHPSSPLPYQHTSTDRLFLPAACLAMQSSAPPTAGESKEALHHPDGQQSIDSHFAQLKAREAQLRALDQQLNARKADLVKRVEDRVRQTYSAPHRTCPLPYHPPTHTHTSVPPLAFSRRPASDC